MMTTTKSVSKAETGKKEKEIRKKEDLTDLFGFFLEELMELYWVEKQYNGLIKKILKPRNQEAVGTFIKILKPDLPTKSETLEKIFEILGEKTRARKSFTVSGIMEEVLSFMDTDFSSNVQNAGVLLGIQKIKYFKISCYSSLRAFATLMDLNEVAEILRINIISEYESSNDLMAQFTGNQSLIEKVNNLYNFGKSVFEDSNKFATWMKTKNLALGNRVPEELLETTFGIAEVETIIGRIEHGIYS